MSLQEKINRRQNDEDMLKCLYASRHFFNVAENYSTTAFVLSVFSALCMFVPDNQQYLSLLVPLLFDILAIILYCKMGGSVSHAALLRNHFDETVLGFNNVQLSQDKLRKIQSLTLKASRNNAEYQKQISNSGRDNPPGVRNWYEFSQNYIDSEVIFECQKQNQWWNKEMHRRRMIICPFILCLGILGVILAGHYLRVTRLEILVCLGGIVVTFFDRIVENILYFRLSLKIDDYCELLSTSKNKKQIKALQTLIEARRELRVVEFNHIHKRNSKKLSAQYEQISKGS